MRRRLLVIKAEIIKQQQHEYHSAFAYFSLFVWPVLGFLEVYYTYKPFALTGYMGISDSRELLAFLGSGFMAYTCFWSMVQNAWSMANQERRGGTLEITFLTPADRLAMNYGRALGALVQEVWMFSSFCIFILLYSGAVHWRNLFLLPVVLILLLTASTIWGGMLNAVFMFSRDAEIVMNLLDTPMTLFAGTRVPAGCFPEWAKCISLIFPLTYCLNIIRFALCIQEKRNPFGDIAGLAFCLGIMIGITIVITKKAEQHNRKTGALQFY